MFQGTQYRKIPWKVFFFFFNSVLFKDNERIRWEKSHLLSVMRTICSWLYIGALYYGYAILCSVMSNSLWFYGLQLARVLCQWNFPGFSILFTGLVHPFWGEYMFLVSHPMSVNVEKLLTIGNYTNNLLLNFLVLTTLYFLWNIHILQCLRESEKWKDILLALLIIYFPLSSWIFYND